MGENPMIIVYLGFLTISLSTFHISGAYITKLGSSAQRSTIDLARIVIVWAFFLIYTGYGHETFSYIQAGGFVGIAIGTIMYNELYVPSL